MEDNKEKIGNFDEEEETVETKKSKFKNFVVKHGKKVALGAAGLAVGAAGFVLGSKLKHEDSDSDIIDIEDYTSLPMMDEEIKEF